MLQTSTNTRQARLQPIIAAAIQEEIQKAARAGLIEFSQFIDPNARKWYRAGHLRRIADLLERVERGELKRVIISVPPRHWKSSLFAKFLAWYLGRHPEQSIINASYALSLAEKASVEVRENIANNGRYKQLFDVKVARNSNRADDWRLVTGFRSSFRAVGVGGGITGHGANLIGIDDPIADYEAAQSETQREKLWEWYRQVLRTRLEPGGAIVLIQTRWHEDDLAGRLLQAERDEGGEHWEGLNLPAYSEETKSYLWTDRYSVGEYAAIRASVGEYAWGSLYQGNPAPLEGNYIKRSWFEYVPKFPDDATWFVRPVDFAFTEKQTQKHDPDFTATLKATVVNDTVFLAEPRMWRKNIEDTAAEVIAIKWNEPSVRLGIGRVAVKSAIVAALNNSGMTIEEYEEDTDKLARASAWIQLASAGRIKLVGTEKEWEPFMAQWAAFPNGAHDDAVDVVSGACRMLGLVFVTGVGSKKHKARGMQLDKALWKAYGR